MLLIGAVVIVSGAFISLSASADVGLAASGDTPHYIWRARLVAEEGLGSLAGSAPDAFKPQAFRPGHPLLAAFLHSVAGIDSFDLIFALPALMASIVGLAAGVFALRGVREPRWAFPVYAVAVGTSVSIVLTAIGRFDNLVVNAVLMAAAVIAVIVANGDRAISAGILLLAGATLVHWSVAAYFAGVLAALALVLVPESLRAWQRGSAMFSTPAARLGLLLGGSAVAGVGALALAPAPPDPPSSPELWQQRVFPKLARQGPRFGVFGPAVVAGVVGLMIPRDPRRRRGLLLALIWAASAPVAVAVALVLPSPAHRILPLALGIPLLAAAGVVGAARLLGRLRPVTLGRVLATAVVLGTLAGGVALSRGVWTAPSPGTREMLEQSATASRYLASVGGQRPVVFISGLQGLRGAFNVIRSGLATDQITRAHVYLGTAENLLEARPTLRPGNDSFNRNSLRHWTVVEPLLDDDPIVMALAAFGGRGRPLPDGTQLAPGVILVRGPAPDPAGVQAAEAPPVPSAAEQVSAVSIALLILGAVGLTWSVSLVPAGWLERVALAPAFGISVLVLGGVVAAHLGADGPDHRLWVALLATIAGAVPGAFRSWRARRAG